MMSKQRDDFLAFDPNTRDNDPWATYAPYRSGRSKFKTHRTRAAALIAFMTNKHYGWCKLYSWDSAARQWILEAILDREGKNHTCDNCGGDTAKDFTAYHRPWSVPAIPNKVGWGDVGKWCWRRQGGRIVTPLELLFVCETCYPAFKR